MSGKYDADTVQICRTRALAMFYGELGKQGALHIDLWHRFRFMLYMDIPLRDTWDLYYPEGAFVDTESGNLEFPDLESAVWDAYRIVGWSDEQIIELFAKYTMGLVEGG